MYKQNNLFKKEKLIKNFYYYIRSKVTMVEPNYESTFYVYLLEISLNKAARDMKEYRLIHLDYLYDEDIPLEYKSLLKLEDGYSEWELDIEQFNELLDTTKTSDEEYILFNASPKNRNENIYHVEF